MSIDYEVIGKRVLQRALEIQRIPAPTFEEEARARYVAQCWATEQVPVERDHVGNVIAYLPAPTPQPDLVISAHLDTVFAREVHMPAQQKGTRWIGPSIGDNSLGVAGLFGVYWAWKHLDLSGSLALVANVAEEGLGNLKGMQAVVDRFGPVSKGYIVLEGLGLGKIYHRGLAVRRYRVDVYTPGGHAWADYGMPSAIHRLAAMIAAMTQWPLPQQPRTTFNVGRIGGGLAVNAIASHAWMDLEFRCESEADLDLWTRRLTQLCRNFENDKIRVTLTSLGHRKGGAVPSDHPLVQKALEAHQRHGIHPLLSIGSTDANVPLSRGYPAIALGLTRGGGAHTLHEYIETPSLTTGLAILIDLIRSLLSH